MFYVLLSNGATLRFRSAKFCAPGYGRCAFWDGALLNRKFEEFKIF